jgi:integrase
VLRFRRGRIPEDLGTGLAPKTVKNVQRMLHRAFTDAVAWDYLGVRTISLDGFTVELLWQYLAMLDEEHDAFGPDYDDKHGKLMRCPDGRRLHADTVTRRFSRLVDRAGVRRIRLHDVRHTYATLSLDSGVHAKIVSDRIGHAHEGITVQIYGHRSTGHDCDAAELVAGLIRRRLQGAS